MPESTTSNESGDTPKEPTAASGSDPGASTQPAKKTAAKKTSSRKTPTKKAAAARPASAPSDDVEIPEGDQFGRLRVRDEDTGHVRTINAVAYPFGNYTVLNEDASDVTGEPVAPVFNPSVESNNDGLQA